MKLFAGNHFVVKTFRNYKDNKVEEDQDFSGNANEKNKAFSQAWSVVDSGLEMEQGQ